MFNPSPSGNEQAMPLQRPMPQHRPMPLHRPMQPSPGATVDGSPDGPTSSLSANAGQQAHSAVHDRPWTASAEASACDGVDESDPPGFVLACPLCRAPLQVLGQDLVRCPAEDVPYHRVDGIWRFMVPERASHYQQFIREYEAVRHAEGRGSNDPAYYRALPFVDLSGKYQDDWHIRARSYQAFGKVVLRELTLCQDRALRIVDLGAGNGWLSHRLAARGHCVAAVDLLTNAFDGLGAHRHYEFSFMPVQAEFDRLPFAGAQADLIVFNGSLHYSTSFETTLAEALRVLRPDGQLVIMDSPVYHDADSGRRMVAEREEQFRNRYGFASNAIPAENYLTDERLQELAGGLEVSWELVEPWYGWRWALRPWRARLRGRREPARFLLIVGRPHGRQV